ncbi:two-component system chemotaxis sensor kinase CheA [Clostridium tetanomorphum]|uniref:Chemotaxis protein CheA n=1 Tax=Clostridium tetanomorphum TaxID=1553 RepID=A0A923ED51_CLOTT|nr:chemotaxis protein CheA [Clostridium tetanomorphum]KAJ49532.1 Signal transduction histidine kinase CheA [Clostridium tetanomorphum DSM 665]KAJ52184.1 Signal transduction histidine kinase CheA [Clostridium tetanomorphum DSM 665]MBC2398954.1 chemotaxis protein CheA [Clostridium tetanomorphum]MBP1866369.1 two-component system chemotaxis sensor kinase CheA [Clostridium tetanomorphum]NRS86546.1 two-component system chemotaxis sensor kinase CheA [Clostridium tetanomorphum]
MTSDYTNDPMLELFVYETSQQLEQLEQSLIKCEESNTYSDDTINEIFRIMHTIKSSAAMMLFNNISSIAHSTEDIFYVLRENKPDNVNYSDINDLVLEGVDFIKIELEKIKNNDEVDGDASIIISKLKNHLKALKETMGNINDHSEKLKTNFEPKQQYYISSSKTEQQYYENSYKVVIYFEKDCEMENIRAFSIIHNLKDITEEYSYLPEDITDNNDSAEVIKKDGFVIYFKANKTYEEMCEFFQKVFFLESFQLTLLENGKELSTFEKEKKVVDNNVIVPTIDNKKTQNDNEIRSSSSSHQSIISVSVRKLDKLMDLIGELVITEAMVTQNPDLKDVHLDNFLKSARRLRKIINETQNMVMSIRMVPLEPTFMKMNRIVRDMNKKLGKDVKLNIIGEDTEVDKNVIEHISDPLMHIVKNSIDHGIESKEERIEKGKTEWGTITLEAHTEGSEVFIIVKDDGRGLDKSKILTKAKEHGAIKKPEEEMTDKEIYSLIFLPGFSTKENVTEFSGRGVGMDVVTKNIEAIGGSILVDSSVNVGTTITMKIPLSLAIIDGMNIKVGNSRYTIPTISIRESFRAREKDIIKDIDGNEMIMIRGECYPILRLYQFYNVKTDITNMQDGIIIMVENNEKFLCIFADELLGEQQVVVKELPAYIKNIKKIKGIAGCTLLGDGSISLIFDINDLMNN